MAPETLRQQAVTLAQFRQLALLPGFALPVRSVFAAG